MPDRHVTRSGDDGTVTFGNKATLTYTSIESVQNGIFTFSTSDYAKVGIVSVLIAIAYGILVMAPWYAFLGIPLWDASAPWPF